MTDIVLPNAPQSLVPLVESGRTPRRRVWGMLFLRSGLSFGLLLSLAAILAVRGSPSALRDSSAWWLWFITVTNIVCIVLLVKFGRLEGLHLRHLYFVERTTWRGDLAWTLAALVVTAFIVQPPGNVLAQALWGDPNSPNTMLFQPLPLWAIYPLFFLMPTLHALAELPKYWGYVAPRLRAMGWNRWLVIGVVGAVLSVQHMFFAFQWDWAYDVWLAVKFLPFAIWTGIVIDRRPTALPYLMAGHFLLDAALPYIVLTVSTGGSLSG